MIAGLGLTAVADFLTGQQLFLAAVGGTFLCYLGVLTLLSAPAGQAAAVAGVGNWGAYAGTFVLTLTNPMTIFSFLAVFAGLGLATAGGTPGKAAVLVLGVFLGSAFWWLLLSGGVSLLRRRIGPRVLVWVNRLAGALLIGFGLFLLFDLLPGR
jgi:threonine/homoserine/homoserine lactone efflux protein